MCLRLGHVIKMHSSYPENSPVNIDHTVLNLYRCGDYYARGLENTQQIQKYFPVKNSGIDWNALFHIYNNRTPSTIRDFNRSYTILEKDIENHKNNLLKTIFNSRIITFNTTPF